MIQAVDFLVLFAKRDGKFTLLVKGILVQQPYFW